MSTDHHHPGLIKNRSVRADGESLTIQGIMDTARYRADVEIGEDSLARLEPSLNFIAEALSHQEKIYGVTTGFGPLKDVVVNPEDSSELSHNIILSHAAGVGEALPEEIVRASILIRINSLIKGHSGVKKDTVQALLSLLNHHIYPLVPKYGSVGASGDLAPLCHICSTIIGHGKVWDATQGWVESTKSTQEVPNITLGPKEGLALSNGTSVSTAIAAINYFDAKHLCKLADISAALSLEAITGGLDAFNHNIHKVRPHVGQIQTAENIRQIVQGSELVHSIPGKYPRVQDAYSFRCVPQVHGAARDFVDFAGRIITTEINAATDNPLIFPEDGLALSGGNFHAEYLAMAMSTVANSIAEIGNISERRTARLVDAGLNNGLPSFLINPEKVGLHSGLMIPQYTSASLVAANKVLAHPATVDSIPTSANQEDHVSFAPTVGLNTRQIIDNVYHILAIEIFSACQGIDFRDPAKLGSGTKVAYQMVRDIVSQVTADRELSEDIEKITDLIHHPRFIEAVEVACGTLN